MKILYLSANSSYSHSSLAYGQIYSYTNEKIKGLKWDFIECTTKDNINEVILKIFEKEPDIFISTAYLFNRNFIIELIKKLKLLNHDLKIILGGPEFLGNNENTLRDLPEIDSVFRGDESSFYKYIKSILNKSYEYTDIPGICYINKENEYWDNGTAAFNNKDLDSLPSPYETALIANNKPFLQIETSRGCFSKCSFCTSSLSNSVKFYSIERVKNDLLKIKNTGCKEIRILDRTFNLPTDRACALLNMFINDFSELKFHLEFEPDKLTNEILENLIKAHRNQFHIEAGVQTFHEPSLKFINRRNNSSDTLNKLKSLISLKNIEVHTDLIYGLPLQTADSVHNDLETIIKIGPAEIQLEVLKILPGTPIKKEIEKHIKYSSDPPYEVLETTELNLKEIINFSYISKLIDCFYNHDELQKLVRFAVIQNKNFLSEFSSFSHKYLSLPEKPSLKNRLKLLLDFSKTNKNSILNEFTLFSAFKMGFFELEEGNLELIKKDRLSDFIDKIKSVVYNDSKNLLNKPVYLTFFNFNIDELWNEPLIEIKKKKTNCLFRLSQSGLSKKISRIDLIDSV